MGRGAGQTQVLKEPMRQAWVPVLGSHPGSPQSLSTHPHPGLGPWVNPSPGCWRSWDLSLLGWEVRMVMVPLEGSVGRILIR